MFRVDHTCVREVDENGLVVDSEECHASLHREICCLLFWFFFFKSPIYLCLSQTRPRRPLEHVPCEISLAWLPISRNRGEIRNQSSLLLLLATWPEHTKQTAGLPRLGCRSVPVSLEVSTHACAEMTFFLS